jgi:hypothetical protein
MQMKNASEWKFNLLACSGFLPFLAQARSRLQDESQQKVA